MARHGGTASFRFLMCASFPLGILMRPNWPNVAGLAISFPPRSKRALLQNSIQGGGRPSTPHYCRCLTFLWRKSQMTPRCFRARPATRSWLFWVWFLADSSWDSCVPRVPRRRRVRDRPGPFASAAEPGDEGQVQPRYCPSESRLKPKQPFHQHLRDESSCERILVEVKNSSGMTIDVFRVNSGGREVLELTFDPTQSSMVAACRGQFWRARASSAGAHGRRRLLSEVTVPPADLAANVGGVDGAAGAVGDTGSADSAGATNTYNAPGGAFLWEVLGCVGYPLPESFGVSSSLGGLGHLQMAREKEATVHPSTDIEGLVSVTLEEAFRGKDVFVTVPRRVLCPVCHGFGAASFVSCDRCGGSGKRIHDAQLSHGDDGPPGGSRRSHCHGTSTETKGNTAELYECGSNNSSCSSSVGRDSAGGGGYGGGCLRQNDSRTQHTLNNCSDGSFRGQEVNPDDSNVNKDDSSGNALKLSHTRDCAKCRGSGKVPVPRNEEGGGYCTRCAGAGFVEEESELILSIPAGVEKGQTEEYKDKGHVHLADLMKSFQPKAANEQASTDNETDAPVRDATDPAPTPSPAPPPPPDTTSPTSTKAFFAPPRPKVKTGSFRLTVDVLEHPVFWRGDDGPDLFTSVAISLDEALTGFTREITALDGSVVSLRRTDRTLPGMVLRFPGLGMPIAVPQDRNGPTTSYADNSKPMSPLPGHITKVAGNNVIEVVSGAPAGAAAEEGRTEEDSASASAGRNVGFGDLFVEASVTLPSGIRDDRSKFIGEFLKPGSDKAREEEGMEGIEQEGRERWETRRGWSRRERRRRAEAEAAVDDVPEA